MKNPRTIRQLAASAASLAALACALAPAPASAQALSDDWQFRGSVYLWTPKLKGTANLPRNNTADFDLPFHEVWDNLKMGGMASIEAQHGVWGGFADLIYLDLGAAGARSRNRTIDGVAVPATVNLNTSLDLKGVITTFGGSYRVLAEPGSSIDVLAGLRSLYMDVSVEHSLGTDFGPFTGPARTGSRSASGTAWDAIVGVKGRQAFGDHGEWFIPYYADVGTGDSHVTYQAAAGIGYTFAWGEASASWRYLTWHQPGTPLDRLTVNGPQFALAFKW